ncbi:B-box type zinc finger protein ncl-1 [Oopsacas minuta]|uniref:B-box type zinc finger protein ncl-1 n=1 Tax=Oopsacas minuta TaxID=111878 RepID=A0AAV7KCI1_9METZ|nr:B-box type zinc finger protein ncl-1 [Oopsacas minuta]
MSGSSDPKCVVCKEAFELEENGMPQHYGNRSFEDLANVKTLMGNIKIGSSMCDLCKKAKASIYCRECKMIMCQHDANTHAKSSKQEHKLFKLEAFDDYDNIFKLIPENTRNMCRQHSEKQIQLYCYRCNEVLCIECTNEGHARNKCYVNEILDSFNGRRQIVSDKQKEQALKVKELLSESKRLCEILKGISRQEDELLKSIDSHFDTYIEQLKTRHNKLNNTIKTVFANRKIEIEDAMESHEKFIKESKRLLEMTSFFLNELPGTHLFPPAVALCNKMDTFERTRSIITTYQNKIEFQFKQDSQFVNDPLRMGKFNFRFPLGFETPRCTIDLISKLKLSNNIKLAGIVKTSNGGMQVLLHDDKEDKNSQANMILRLNSCFKPLKKHKWLEPMNALDDKTTISHFYATPDGIVLIVDRNKKMLQAMYDGKVKSAVSGNSESGSPMSDPFNVITGKGERFIVYNKEPHQVEIYTSDSKLEHSFELYPVIKTTPMPTTPVTTKQDTFGSSQDLSSDFMSGFITISQPAKRATPEAPQRIVYDPYTNLQIASNSFGDIYYVFDNKPVIKRFTEQGEELKEFKFLDSRADGPARVHSSSKVPLPTRQPLERSGTLRKNNPGTRPINLTIPVGNTAPTKPKSSKTLISIDHFDNVYLYQNGYIYVLDMSLDSVRTRGKIDFEPDFMMISNMGHLILVTQNDAMIRVY